MLEETLYLEDGAKRLIAIFLKAGFQIYVVGGFVRDSLLGRAKASGDIDFTTNAKPEEIIKLFPKSIASGVKYGTLILPVAGKFYEVTTFRFERGYSDSRHPDVISYATTLEEDLQRRDFTVNALAYDAEHKRIIDRFGGREDIKRKRLVCIGRAKDRLAEDALRILRACRFAAQLDFEVDESCLQAMEELRSILSDLSSERIRDELIKILLSNNPDKAFLLMAQTKLLTVFFPELAATEGVVQNRFHSFDVFQHTLASLKAFVRIRQALPAASQENLDFPVTKGRVKKEFSRPEFSKPEFSRPAFATKFFLDSYNKENKEREKDKGYPLLKEYYIPLALLFHDIAKPQTKKLGELGEDYATFYGHEKESSKIALDVLERFRFSKKDRQLVATLVREHMVHNTKEWSDAALRRFVGRVGEAVLPSLLLLVQADKMAVSSNPQVAEETTQELLQFEKRLAKYLSARPPLSLPALALDGNILMKEFSLPPSPFLGKILKYLLSCVIDDPSLNTRPRLVKQAKEYIKHVRKNT